MVNTLIDNLTKDISNAATVKLAALGANLAINEKTAVDWRALAAQAKNAITSPEMGNILRRANQRGLYLGTLHGALRSIMGGLDGTIRGYKNSGPGAWNKVKGTFGGGIKGQLKGMATGFMGGYGGGAGGSILGDALIGDKDMQALKEYFK